MKRFWIIGYFVIVLAVLTFAASKSIIIDPFFHYHAPDTGHWFYKLDNPRSQNDGILRHFSYEGIITGSSMTQNYKTSEAEDLFGASFIKVPLQGGTFFEINNQLLVAAASNDKLKIVIRGLDIGKLFDDKDLLRTELGIYPTYLYDKNPFNDVKYVFNRDVLFSRVFPMMDAEGKPGSKGGITTFDSYSNWMAYYSFGWKTVLPDGLPDTNIPVQIHLTREDADTVRSNIRQNVTAIAELYPDITFYCFFTPYSAAWWKQALAEGKLDRQIEAERIAIEEILQHPNIRLYSFSCLFDITTDLNNYKDTYHYGEWINSLILSYMKAGKCLLTQGNYMQYLEREQQFYTTFDYKTLIAQEDYESDSFAAALLNEKITGTKPYPIDLRTSDNVELRNASLKTDPADGRDCLVCTGTLARVSGNDIPITDYMRDKTYIGAKIRIDDATPYRYLAFRGRKAEDHGQITIRLYNVDGKAIVSRSVHYQKLDREWHRYAFDIRSAEGPCTLILNGGYIDDTGNPDSQFIFSDIVLY